MLAPNFADVSLLSCTRNLMTIETLLFVDSCDVDVTEHDSDADAKAFMSSVIADALAGDSLQLAPISLGRGEKQ